MFSCSDMFGVPASGNEYVVLYSSDHIKYVTLPDLVFLLFSFSKRLLWKHVALETNLSLLIHVCSGVHHVELCSLS